MAHSNREDCGKSDICFVSLRACSTKISGGDYKYFYKKKIIIWNRDFLKI